MSPEENFKRQADARGALAKTRQRLSLAMTAFSLVFVLLFGRLVEVSVLREPGDVLRDAIVEVQFVLIEQLRDRNRGDGFSCAHPDGQ